MGNDATGETQRVYPREFSKLMDVPDEVLNKWIRETDPSYQLGPASMMEERLRRDSLTAAKAQEKLGASLEKLTARLVWLTVFLVAMTAALIAIAVAQTFHIIG